MVNNNLVGGALEKPSSKMMVHEFVNGVGMTSPIYEMENHPFMFETTNQ